MSAACSDQEALAAAVGAQAAGSCLFGCAARHDPPAWCSRRTACAHTSVPAPVRALLFSPTCATYKRQPAHRYKWDDETLADATPSSVVVPKAPKRTVVSYRFTSDAFLREHYRNPWGNVRLGRVLEDLDSFAGFIAFEHW